MLMIGLMHKVRALGLGKLLSFHDAPSFANWIFISHNDYQFKIINHEAINTD